MTILAVAIGGAAGAVTRYLLAVRLYEEMGVGFPWGTLGVNVLGSLLLGVMLGLIEERHVFSPDVRSLITIGFLGGMTTFSTFIYEGWQFVRDGDPLRAGVYVCLSLLMAFLAFATALSVTKAAA